MHPNQIAISECWIKKSAAGRCQYGGGPIEILKASQPRLLVGFSGIAEKFVEQHIKHFDHVVLRGRFQAVDEGN